MEGKDYDFVELSFGKTCYQVKGGGTFPVVVLVHGLSSPMCIWDKNIDEMVKAGLCVVRYDLYGRGKSSRPKLRYNADLFISQLKELIEYLSLPLPVHLVGLSMGGAIVAEFTVRYPKMVDRIGLIAPAGLIKRSVGVRVITLPVIGKIIYEIFGKEALIRGVLETIGDSVEDRKRMREVYEEQMNIAGYRDAILSTLKYGPLYGKYLIYEELGKQTRKGCLIWGKCDDVVPYILSEEILRCVPWLKLYAIEGGTHTVNYQKANEVNPILCSFFTS
ncbi:MAG: alpha/beta hydrolase [Candidatus Hydrogenedens sp.]|nr:alpha/beta hydrolase [Candidatus Hydrogenedens sp.]